MIFWCNKRTPLLTANKLLLDFTTADSFNLLIDFDNKKFNELLANYYYYKYLNNKNLMILRMLYWYF